ncbi:MAG: ABC transporter ATP-binding protein/permease [Chloroflexi bacterium]|nr:ABC transporter ATP-binding protein/permease [Chloroflexota bacterium]
MTNWQTWKRMMRYMLPYKKWASYALVGVILGMALQITIPTILRYVVDRGIAERDADFMLQAGVLIIVLGIARGAAGFLFRYFGEKMSHQIAYDVRNEVYDKVQNLSFSYHNQAQTGTLITRAISDVDEIQRYFGFGLIDGLNTALLTIGIAVVMFYTSPLLTIVTMLPLIPLAFMSRNFAMQVDPMWRKVMDQIQILSAHLQENVVGAQVVRAFAREDYEINKWKVQNDKLYTDHITLIDRWSRYLPASALLAASSTALVLIFGGLMQQNDMGGVTIGIVVAFNAYVLMLAQPLRFLGFVILLLTQAVASSHRVFEVLDAEVAIDSKPDAVEMPTINGYIKFENVNFVYDDGNQPALRKINFETTPGQVVAVLGQTGSGKTTLVNLIPRFFDVTDGAVTIDGYDVREVELRSLRRQIGFVLQESMLFSASIHENIAYGRTDATREEVIAAARAANAHDFIMEFPDGYETEIGERGVTLSGGQRQRVAIARALLIDPRILVLDDSTSSVDTQTEFEIQEALNELMKGRTTFVIAQRLNTVKEAGLILVLADGEIVERGQHDDLLEQNGLYAEIYRLQLADQERLKQELIALGGLVDVIEHKRETGEYNMQQLNEFSGD